MSYRFGYQTGHAWNLCNIIKKKGSQSYLLVLLE